MKRISHWCLALLAVWATGASVPPRPAATRPAAPKPSAVDYVADLFELYYQGRERGRFFAAAGVDGEMTKAEFQAAGGKAGSFVRPYDRWVAVAVFDRDHNGRLDWVEAVLYRLAIRTRVLTLFDKDADGRLFGAEREAANAYLAARAPKARKARKAPPSKGPAPAAVRPKLPGVMGPPGPVPTDPAAAAWRRRWEQLQARHDADKDGSLTDAERTRLHEGLRAEYRRSIVKKFDRNRDGKLDEAEGRALDADQAARTDKWRRRMELMEWDANRNARLDPAERDKRDRHLAELRRRAQDRRGEWVRRWDGDGDGKLSGAELAAATAGISERVARQRREMDTDGDGRITAKEIRAYRKKLFGRRPAGATTRRGDPP